MEDLPEFLKKRDGHTRSSSRQREFVVRDYYEYESEEIRDGAATLVAPPWIDPSTPTNVTVVAGRTAILACVVRDLGTASVRLLSSVYRDWFFLGCVTHL